MGAMVVGSLDVDPALGVGGLPRGHIVEFYGPESCDKIALALSVIAQAQKAGLTAAFIDAQHAFDLLDAQTLGVKIEDVLVSQPDYSEQAFEIIDTLVSSRAVDVLVVNSVEALVPKSELEGDTEEASVDMKANLMGHAIRKLNETVNNANALVIFINQIRTKVGELFDNFETTQEPRAA